MHENGVENAYCDAEGQGVENVQLADDNPFIFITQFFSIVFRWISLHWMSWPWDRKHKNHCGWAPSLPQPATVSNSHSKAIHSERNNKNVFLSPSFGHFHSIFFFTHSGIPIIWIEFNWLNNNIFFVDAIRVSRLSMKFIDSIAERLLILKSWN